MRLLFSICLLACSATVAVAQVIGPKIPDSLNVQGFLQDTQGSVNEPVDMTFKLYSGSTEIWSQTQSNVPVSNGVFNAILGGSGANDLGKISFNKPIELGITVNGEELTPRTALVAAPYALAVRGLYAVDSKNGNDEAPNIIAGASNNFISSRLFVGATIGGGGGMASSFASAQPAPNEVTGDWGTIAGGRSNTAGRLASIGGGAGNFANSWGATIGGGRSNSVPGGEYSTIGGGYFNFARGNSATVPGGYQNVATKGFTFAAGQRARASHSGSFVWADSASATGVNFESTGDNQFLVRAAGGVGIGTNAPREALHVQDETESTGIFLGGNGTFGPHGIVFDDDEPGEGLSLLYRTGPNRLVLEPSSRGTVLDTVDVFYYDRDDEEFAFQGVIKPTAGDKYSLGNSGSRWSEVFAKNGVINTSDRNAKSGIEDLEAGLAEILSLRPVTFRWKDRAKDDRQIGLIAQEVDAVIPEVVRRPDGDGDFYGLNYSELIPVLIKAIQEQQAVIESQASRLEALEARITN